MSFKSEQIKLNGFLPSSFFSRWIFRLMRARRRLDAGDLAASALWGAYECLRNGVTSIADTSYEGYTVARAAGAAGLRARVHLEVFGLDDARLPQTIERLETALEGAPRVDKVEWGLSPHAPYTVSERLYREVAHLARRLGLRMASHVAESRAETRLLSKGNGALALAYKAAHLWTGQRWTPPKTSPMTYVARSGALGPDMLAVHAVQLDGGDVGTLAAGGAAVAHCPRSNRYLRCGTAPVAEMKAAGVTIGLGTDSLASNYSLDILAEMRAALAAARERAARNDALAPPSPGDILAMATLDGAKALGWDKLVGSLEAGKRADVAAVRLPDREAHSADLLAEMVMSGEVKMTMVDGDVLYPLAQSEAGVVQGLSIARRKLGLKD